MIIVQVTGYTSPVAEQEFASLTPTPILHNIGTVAVDITGLVNIYRTSTGAVIYTSQLRPGPLAVGEALEYEALTPWSPPAPLDDEYFITCQITAVSIPPAEPESKVFWLGPYSFDIKPVGMGPAPAAHAPTHEQAGADPIETEDLGTTELDTTKVLTPDGAGGVAFVPIPATLDHGALTGLADDDHPQYRLRHEILKQCEMLYASVTAHPWRNAPFASGTAVEIAGTPSHPGVCRLSSSVSANSGYRFFILTPAILLAGGEISRSWHRPQTLAGTTRHHGFHNTLLAADPVNGAWIWQDPATGIIYGRTRSNSVGSTTGTGYQLVTNTWYFEKVVVNADATRVDFYLYDDAGALLWTDNLTTNIPTAAGRELGHGVIASNSGTTAVALDDLDYLSLLIPDRRPDL